jgi:hypothetical protein
MAELEQISSKETDGVKTMPDNFIGCRNQILAEKESNFFKVSEGKPRN